MSAEGIITISITIVAGVLGFLLKDYLKGVKKELHNQNESIDKLLEIFNKFQIDLVKVEATLTSIKKDQDKANNNLKETKSLAHSNSDRITNHGHELRNLKHGVEGLMDIVKDNSSKVKELEKSVFLLQQNKGNEAK